MGESGTRAPEPSHTVCHARCSTEAWDSPQRRSARTADAPPLLPVLQAGHRDSDSHASGSRYAAFPLTSNSSVSGRVRRRRKLGLCRWRPIGGGPQWGSRAVKTTPGAPPHIHAPWPLCDPLWSLTAAL